MKKSKIINIIVSSAAAASLVFTTAFASFPDVSADKYSWAVDAINSMADKGIIKGYEDGTFNPEKSVTKLEGLALVARILGCNDSENDSFMDEAAYLYKDRIDKYELTFGENEIAYLLLKGVIGTDELDNYIGKDNFNSGLKRYEIAVLLTKALDAEDGLSSSTLSYADADEIPAAAKKYVGYVTDQGLMNGMDENNFSPNTNVTRAQAAVVLKKLDNKTGYEFRSATVVEMDTVTGILRLKDNKGESFSHSILPGVILRYDGERISASEINSGYIASVTYKNDEVYAVDFTPSLADDYVYGSVSAVSTRDGGANITIFTLGENDKAPSSEKQTYKLTDDAVVTYNGDTSSLASLKSGYYVKLTVKSGRVRYIEAFDKQSQVTGTIESIILSPDFKIAVTDKSGDTYEYLFKDSATVSKNGKSSDASELTEGDSVVVTLEYERISKVTATSKTSTKTGVISQILISDKPKLTLTIDGEDVTYPLSTSAEYTLSGTAGSGSIYDLRTNTTAVVTVESNTITKISTTAASESKTITGTVASVTPAANVFQVTYTDSALGIVQTDTVVVNSKTTIIDINGKSKKISDLAVGTSVTVYGTIGSGVVSATTVMKIS